MQTEMLLRPSSFEEAADFLRSKPVVAKQVFMRLLPELRARAFTVAGLEAADDLRTVRDEIARLPQGARWGDAKDNIIGLLVAHTEEDSVAANRHAELLLRMQGFQSYSAARYDLAMETRDEMGFLMYNSREDSRVRPEHDALDGLVLPVDDVFWSTHTPPWDWGCRCYITQISSAEFAKIKAGEAYGRALGPAEHKRLNLTGELDDGAGHTITIRTPQQRALENGQDPALAWHWSPGDLRIPLDSLRARYAADPETWNVFREFAQNTELNFGGLRHSLWDDLLDHDRSLARAEVLAFGAKTGGEMAVAINYDTGERVGSAVSTPDQPHQVDVSGLIDHAEAKHIRLSLAHNHPDGDTFTPADLAKLARPPVVEVLAHTHWIMYRVVRQKAFSVEQGARFVKLMSAWDADLRSGRKSVAEWLNYLQGSNIRGVIKYEAIIAS